jgi:hypothetical protein
METMQFDLKQFVRMVMACVLAVIFAVPQNLLAQATEHVVGAAELRQSAVAASQARQQNLQAVKEFVSSAKAQQALKAAHMNPEQVKEAVASLSDAELAQLASRVHKSQADFAAGNLTDRDLIIILVAIAALILIIVAVR